MRSLAAMASRALAPAVALAILAGHPASAQIATAPPFETSSGDTAPRAEVVAYAFAKASPLQMFDSADLTSSTSQAFAFGVAYEIIERTTQSVRIRRPDGAGGYLRLAHVSVVPAPSWVVSSSAFNRKDRARIRFWESSSKLNDFLANTSPEQSPFDFEEVLGAAPAFPLRLPIYATDTLELMGGERQITIAGVLAPISREMVTAFEAVKTGAARKLDVHLVLDVSGSTGGFLGPALGSFVTSVNRDAALQASVSRTSVTVFGLNLPTKALHLGETPLAALETVDWDIVGIDTPTVGDEEPLGSALTLLAGSLRPDPKADFCMIVLSGAEIALDDEGFARLAESLPSGSAAIFAQITPEPGRGLQEAARRIAASASVEEIPFSESLGAQVAKRLVALTTAESGVVDAETLEPFSTAAAASRMLAFLPPKVKSDTILPKPQAYAQNADWYTVRLWVALDELVLSETSDPPG